MKGILAAVAVALVVAGGVRAQDKDAKKDDKKVDAAKLVGKWELTKSTDAGAPKGAIVEFTKDMKLKISIEFNGKNLDLDGTYKVDGDKLTVTIKSPDGKEDSDTDTIKSLTDEKVVLLDKEGKETELTKKK